MKERVGKDVKRKTPFDKQNGNPYFECHQIDWLSKDGMDFADNCVSHCPNLQRKIQILNGPTDISTLKAKLKIDEITVLLTRSLDGVWFLFPMREGMSINMIGLFNSPD